MSGTVRTTWCRLIDDKKAAFLRQGHQLPSHINSEDSFRTYFESFCRCNHERYYTRLLAKLRYSSINTLASAVDALLYFTASTSLTGLVLGGIFLTIKARVNIPC